MKKMFLYALTLLATAVSTMFPTAMSAQNQDAEEPKSAQDQLVPRSSEQGWWTIDGTTHRGWILLADDATRSRFLVIPAQTGRHEMSTYTPDDVSAWGMDNAQTSWLSIDYDGQKWFMEQLSVMADGVRLCWFSAAATSYPTARKTAGTSTSFDRNTDAGTLFAVSPEGVATRICSKEDARPLFDFLALSSGFQPSDRESVRFQKRLKINRDRFVYKQTYESNGKDKRNPSNYYNIQSKRSEGNVIAYYNRAYTSRNDKMFPRRRLGVSASYGSALYHPRMGDLFAAGIFTSIPLGRYGSLRPELNYMRYSGPTVDNRQSWSHSLRVPMLFRVANLSSRRSVLPYLDAGLVGELGTLNKMIPDPYLIDQPKWVHTDMGTMLRFGLMLGGGAEWHLSTRHVVSLGVRLSVGLLCTSGIFSNINTMEIVAAWSLFNY